MSQSGGSGVVDGGSGTPGTLKRKRDLAEYTAAASLREKAAKFTDGGDPRASSQAQDFNSTSAQHPASYISPESDEQQHSDSGDLLRGIGSASSLNSTASSVFSRNSNALAGNTKGSLANGLTPLTNHTESSPNKADSPDHSKTASNMASANGGMATSHVHTTAITPEPTQPSTARPQMLPPTGKAKGYKVVWDPELDSKLSREERKRAQPRRRDFGTEVRCIFYDHNLLSLRNMMIHIT